MDPLGRVKSKARFGATLALLVLSTFALVSPIHADAPPRKILTGWIPYYSLKTSLPDALNNSDLIKEVMPFWYTLKFDGKNKVAVVTDLYAPANPSVPISEPLTALRNAGFSIIPTITDGTDKGVLAGLLKNAASRTQVVNAILTMVRTNNYEGIDLDFEGFAFVDGNATWPTTAPLWSAFVKELGTALHAENKVLSVSTPYVLDPKGTQKGYYVYAWAAIAPYIDKLRIMTYDYSVAKVGPLGPITWTERTIQYATSIMPASKVYVGIPGYGRDWVTAVSGICPANVANTVKVGAKAATFVMRDATTLASTYGATPTFNDQFGEMTFSYQKVYNGVTASGLATSCTASRTAWYQDAKAWGLRAALVSKYQLGGVTAWTLGMEEPMAMEAIRQIGKQIAPDQVSAILEVDKSAIEIGNPVLITGTFTIKDKSAVANLPVRIEGKSPADTSWRTLSTATTGVDGKFAKALIVSRSMSIRLISDATWERTQGLSSELAVSVNRGISVSAPASAKSLTSIQITGVVRPRAAGISVSLESLVGKEWRTLGSPVTTDTQGNYIFTVASQPRGVLALRVKVASDSTWQDALSPTFNIIFR